ncbi:MAG: cation:proton antiporter [Deltaproteobacteria bacterium]|nr:cation:proton antiporter [Deltaproteobacteria bacterium]
MDLSYHPAIILSIAVVSSLLSEIRIGVRIPGAVWEILLGMAVGRAVLGLASIPHGELWGCFAPAGLAALLFMAGMDIDFGRVRGRPMELALGGWLLSLGLGLLLATILWVLGIVQVPMIVALTLSTTALGTIIPSLQDSGSLNTRLGTHVLAAGSIGEFGPFLATSLLLTRKFDAWLQLTVLLGFTALAVACALIAVRLRTPAILRLLARGMRPSSQLPVCLSLLIVSSFVVIAEKIGFEAVVGSFSAGMVIGLATSDRSEDQELFREKMEAICFAVFIPFFFVMSRLTLDVHALFQSARSFMLVPVFLAMFVVVRGSPVLLHRSELRKEERLPFALYSATELPMVVAITEIGVRLNIMGTEIATALIGAGLLSVLLFPAIADAMQVPPPVQSRTASATD